ncbi:unnamed protein product [Soboliphyme baturini]|uniref:Uncharacterized protein n=1 Tax=Soboliphyme baturini TaxID=241478 RepID=A0A183IZX8_9BILA|nr:unnamed protein product [Soboliphyme baturini]
MLSALDTLRSSGTRSVVRLALLHEYGPPAMVGNRIFRCVSCSRNRSISTDIGLHLRNEVEKSSEVFAGIWSNKISI